MDSISVFLIKWGILNIALEETKGTEIESKDYLLKKQVDKEYVQYDFILM